MKFDNEYYRSHMKNERKIIQVKNTVRRKKREYELNIREELEFTRKG